MTSVLFRRLEPEELDAAYAIIVEVTEWLLDKGVRQWLAPLPLDVYRQRHERGQNYGLLIDDELAAVVSLLTDRPIYWDEYLPETAFAWLSTLASSRRYKGYGLGPVTLTEAEASLARDGIGAVYLDCLYGAGHLPQFYESVGYEQVARKVITFLHGDYDSVLMCKSLAYEQTS